MNGEMGFVGCGIAAALAIAFLVGFFVGLAAAQMLF